MIYYDVFVINYTLYFCNSFSILFLQEQEWRSMIENNQIENQIYRRYESYYDWLNSQNFTKQTLLKYDVSKQQWLQYIPTKLNLANIPSNFKQTDNKFHTLTINVLTDSIIQAPLKRNILFSEDRYPYILNFIDVANPHVVTFNQVTYNFYQLLMSAQWVRKRYWVSFFQGSKQRDGSFNVIISRVQPLFLGKIKVQGLKRVILTVYLMLNWETKGKLFTKYISISCAHLTSLSKNIKTRRIQLTNLHKELTCFSSNNDLYAKQMINIVQGDLNIHDEKQNQIFRQLGWRDCWLQYHGKQNNIDYKDQNAILESQPGFTFDGQINTLIKEVYWGFQARRMRLDRILYFKSSPQPQPQISCREMKIVLNEPVYKQQNKNPTEYPRMGWLKGSVSLISDIIGYNIFRYKNKYLFPSDHFGLSAQFNL